MRKSKRLLLFIEPQEGLNCGIHAINNLLQQKVLDKRKMDEQYLEHAYGDNEYSDDIVSSSKLHSNYDYRAVYYALKHYIKNVKCFLVSGKHPIYYNIDDFSHEIDYITKESITSEIEYLKTLNKDSDLYRRESKELNNKLRSRVSINNKIVDEWMDMLDTDYNTGYIIGVTGHWFAIRKFNKWTIIDSIGKSVKVISSNNELKNYLINKKIPGYPDIHTIIWTNYDKLTDWTRTLETNPKFDINIIPRETSRHLSISNLR